jgi:putative membrane protein
MEILANVLVGLVAALHMYILVMEMFLWEKKPGRGLHGFEPELARATAPMAANQGLYNGFLAAGLLWGLVADKTDVQVFFLLCVIVAGVYGAATVSRRILYVQAAPAALALILLWLA